MMKEKILIVAAHPDDEVLGCGGSVAKWSKKGYDVNILIMAEGITSRDDSRDRTSRKNELNHLEAVSKKCSSLLGVKNLKLLQYPDNRMDSVDLLNVCKSIEEHIQFIKPNTIVTHYSNDLNIDHQIIHKAVLTACRPQLSNSIKKILCFETPSSTEWETNSKGVSFSPNWYEDISETLSLKIEALNIYKKEMRDWPHARSIKAINYLARWRGSNVGVEAAEAFMLIRKIN